jgi:hypothetical protein
MDIEYIQKTVGDDLAKAIASLIEIKLHQTKHPLDGIQYLGEYMIYQSKIQSRIGDFQKQEKKVEMIKENLKQEKIELLAQFKQVLDSLVLAVQSREERMEAQRLEKEREEFLQQEKLLKQKEQQQQQAEEEIVSAGQNVDSEPVEGVTPALDETANQDNKPAQETELVAAEEPTPVPQDEPAPVAGGPADAE